MAQFVFDREYREMRKALMLGVISVQDMRDWIWLHGHQTELAMELEMDDDWKRHTQRSNARDMKRDTEMLGDNSDE